MTENELMVKLIDGVKMLTEEELTLAAYFLALERNRKLGQQNPTR